MLQVAHCSGRKHGTAMKKHLENMRSGDFSRIISLAIRANALRPAERHAGAPRELGATGPRPPIVASRALGTSPKRFPPCAFVEVAKKKGKPSRHRTLPVAVEFAAHKWRSALSASQGGQSSPRLSRLPYLNSFVFESGQINHCAYGKPSYLGARQPYSQRARETEGNVYCHWIG